MFSEYRYMEYLVNYLLSLVDFRHALYIAFSIFLLQYHTADGNFEDVLQFEARDGTLTGVVLIDEMLWLLFVSFLIFMQGGTKQFAAAVSDTDSGFTQSSGSSSVDPETSDCK